MPDTHDAYDIASDDEFYLAHDNDAMDITKYHTLVFQNFYLGLSATTEALEETFLLDTDADTHVCKMAAGFLQTFIGYDTPLTGATAQLTALAAALPTLKDLLLRRLRQRIVFKAIVAASDFDMFVKYFPSWKKSYNSFYIANIQIAEGIQNHYKGLCDHFSGWKVHDLGTVIDKVILKARTSQSKVFEHYMGQRDVLHAVIRCWKGNHQKSILRILELVKRLEDKVAPTLLKQSLGLNQLLYHLYTDFQKTGECIIAHWKEKRHWADICSPETITQFAREVWPMLPATAKPRVDPEIKGNASFKIRFDAVVKEIGQVDDFYDLSTGLERAEIHTINAACKEPNLLKRNTNTRLAHERGVADRYLLLMRNLLVQRPDICPNCLGCHALLECAALVQDAWKTPAAFTHLDLENETGKSRLRRQRGYLKCLIRDNNVSSAKPSSSKAKISKSSLDYKMRHPLASSGESLHHVNHFAGVNADSLFTMLAHNQQTQQQSLKTSRLCGLHPSSAADSRVQSHREPFNPSRELPDVTTLFDIGYEHPTVLPHVITSSDIGYALPTVKPVTSSEVALTVLESHHHHEHHHPSQSLDVDSRILTARFGNSSPISASHYIARSSLPEFGARAPSPEESVTKPRDGLPAPDLVKTHDLRDFMDESHGRMPADEPVVFPLLAPDSHISSVLRLEYVFEISHEFRGDSTLNNYTTLPEVANFRGDSTLNNYTTLPEDANFRGDDATATTHQAIKECSHEEPRNTEILPPSADVTILMVSPQTKESHNAFQSCRVVSIIDAPTVLDDPTSNLVIATDKSGIPSQCSEQAQRIIDCGHKDVGLLTPARLDKDVEDKLELYTCPTYSDAMKIYAVAYPERMPRGHHCHLTHYVGETRNGVSFHDNKSEGLEVIRGVSSSGVPVQHVLEEHDTDQRTRTILDDAVCVLLTEDASNSGFRKRSWYQKVLSSCKIASTRLQFQGRSLDAHTL